MAIPSRSGALPAIEAVHECGLLVRAVVASPDRDSGPASVFLEKAARRVFGRPAPDQLGLVPSFLIVSDGVNEGISPTRWSMRHRCPSLIRRSVLVCDHRYRGFMRSSECLLPLRTRSV